jgi:hypothetical protein
MVSMPRVVPAALPRTFYLGGLAAATYFILVVTGVFLMFYYHPSVARAYEDMKALQFVVYMGPFLRNTATGGGRSHRAYRPMTVREVELRGNSRGTREERDGCANYRAAMETTH